MNDQLQKQSFEFVEELCWHLSSCAQNFRDEALTQDVRDRETAIPANEGNAGNAGNAVLSPRLLACQILRHARKGILPHPLPTSHAPLEGRLFKSCRTAAVLEHPDSRTF